MITYELPVMTYQEALQEALKRGFTIISVVTHRYITDELEECDPGGEAVYAIFCDILVDVKTKDIYYLDY